MKNRRLFLQTLGLTALATAACTAQSSRSDGAPLARVVVVGGGYGGATTAKYLRLLDPRIAVTLIEPKAVYYSCPWSNTVVGGMSNIDSLAFRYDNLEKRHGVQVVQDRAVGVDTEKKMLKTASGRTFNYDKLVMSPGIDFKFEAIDGYSQAAAEQMPHAWQAGEQTMLLRKQLEAMPDGGVVAIVAPANPYRCPPGPYERAGLIANYLKKNKPNSKVMILDSKDAFAKQALFLNAWNTLYPGKVEWVSASNGGKVSAVNVANKSIVTDFEEVKVAVANVIPPQKAAKIAFDAGLTNESGFCPVDGKTFASTLAKDVYVIGDSAKADPMPKSGHSANNQGKVVAAAIVSQLNGSPVLEPSLANTCYSLAAENYSVSVAAVYRFDGGKLISVEGAGGVSAANGNPVVEALYAKSWYQNITTDIFA
jgi:sulfide dehydrogenase [flavocytochrome c] flavoprotein subunit